jgi:ketosteroid isomerase-like protein
MGQKGFILMSTYEEQLVWETLHRHIESIFTRDVDTYRETTASDLSLYEWFVAPHRMDGLDFHLFMISQSWAGSNGDFRYDFWEPRLQLYDDTAIVSYTFQLTLCNDGAISHRSHNESRVMIKRDGRWQVVHVHKSPTWEAPQNPPG